MEQVEMIEEKEVENGLFLKLADAIEKPVSGEWGDGDGDTKILRTTNFTNEGNLDLSSVVERNISEKKILQKALQFGDSIIEKSGGSPNQPVGRVVYFNIQNDTYLCNNFTSAIRPKIGIDSKYLFWFLFYNHLSGNTLKYQNKTTGIINLQLERYINETQIPLPPIETQKRIAGILDKADALRRKDQELLQKYDDLAQAIFMDMFGDPVKNEKGWEVKKIGTVCKLQGGYAFSSSSIVDDGIKLVKIGNVHFQDLSWDEVEYLPPDFLHRHKEFSLEDRDILIALTRPIIKSLDSVKVVQVKKEDLPCLLNQRVGRFKPSNRINLTFFLNYLYSKHFKNEVDKYCSTSLQPNVSTSQIEGIEIYLPPIELQNKFETLFYQIQNGSGFMANLQSESLFQSLLQKAFMGDLVE